MSELAMISQLAHEGVALLTVEDSHCLRAYLPACLLKQNLYVQYCLLLCTDLSVETPKFQTKEKKTSTLGCIP